MSNENNENKINIEVVEVGVNFGDHGETVFKGMEVVPGETVDELVERGLLRRNWGAKPDFILNEQAYIVIRPALKRVGVQRPKSGEGSTDVLNTF